MRYDVIFISLLLVITTITSCKKNNDSGINCSAGAPTSRTITDAHATVGKSGSQFYIVEKGSIDTKLEPCNLAAEFQVNKLEVLISGDVKEAIHETSCCTYIFIITKISR